MHRPRTVVFCCNTSFAISNFRAGAIRALIASGHEVVVVAPRDDYVDTLESMGARFEHWELAGRSTNVLSELRSMARLVGIYRRLKADIAFHFTIKSVLYGAIAGRITRTPFVSVITGLGYVFLNTTPLSAVAKCLYRITLRWSQRLWFLNGDDHRVFVEQGLMPATARVDLLPGEGIDLTHFAPTPLPTRQRDKDIVFLMVARLLTDKGIYELIEAARLIRARHPGIQVRLLGPVDTGNPTAIAQAQIDAWCAEGVIDYLGTRKDVRPCIADADAVLLPSYREGLPRSLLEAAAMGRPIIATDVPGCRDVVIDGESGFLCRVRDATDLAARMETFLSLTPAQRNAMGQRGRQLVEQRYDERHVIAKYVLVVEGA